MSAVTVDAPFDLTGLWRRLRLPVLVGAFLVGVAVLLGVFGRTEIRQPLDPHDASPAGARALNQLIHDRGVQVQDVTTPAGVAFTSNDTVFVPDPSALGVGELSVLASSAATVVAVEPGDRELVALGVKAAPEGRVHDTVAANCSDLVATTAGTVRFDGTRYRVRAGHGCYGPTGERGLVLSRRAAGSTFVFGSPATFSNDRLADEGDAALALGLLTQRPHLYWVLPQPATHAPADQDDEGLLDLLPDRLLWAVLQLVVAVFVLALWRARRLGPVIAEPLPVIVRAVETVEGRARLLRAARARGTAARSLRDATAARLRDVLALGADAPRVAVVESVSRQTGRPAPEVDRLLYGAEPNDDRALLDLATALADLEAALRRT